MKMLHFCSINSDLCFRKPGMQEKKTGTDLFVKEGEIKEAECITLHSALGEKQWFGQK